MLTGAGVEVGIRQRVLLMLMGVTLTTLLFAAAAHAAISAFEPWKGTVAPGESMTATFTVVDSFTSCFTVGAPSGLSATLDGLGLGSLPASCAVSGTLVTMTVAADSEVSPGDYTVKLTESALNGQLLGTHEWPVAVIEPPAPTTTTTTTIPTSTTSSTTIPDLTTTTTSTVSAVVTVTTPPTAPSTRASDGAPGTASTATDAPAETDSNAGIVLSADSTVRDGPEVLGFGVERRDRPDGRRTRQPADAEPPPLSHAPLSDRLRVHASTVFPPLIADAVVSPIMIGKYLVHSVLDSSRRLLVPIVIGTLIGLLMVWRMRTVIAKDGPPLSRFSVE